MLSAHLHSRIGCIQLLAGKSPFINSWFPPLFDGAQQSGDILHNRGAILDQSFNGRNSDLSVIHCLSSLVFRQFWRSMEKGVGISNTLGDHLPAAGKMVSWWWPAAACGPHQARPARLQQQPVAVDHPWQPHHPEGRSGHAPSGRPV